MSHELNLLRGAKYKFRAHTTSIGPHNIYQFYMHYSPRPVPNEVRLTKANNLLVCANLMFTLHFKPIDQFGQIEQRYALSHLKPKTFQYFSHLYLFVRVCSIIKPARVFPGAFQIKGKRTTHNNRSTHTRTLSHTPSADRKPNPGMGLCPNDDIADFHGTNVSCSRAERLEGQLKISPKSKRCA